MGFFCIGLEDAKLCSK